MSLKVKKLLHISLIIFYLLNIISLTFGQCVVSFPKDNLLQPKNVLLKIGSRQVDIILNKANTDLNIYDGQEVEIECETKFKHPERCNDKHKITIKCSDYNGIYIDGNNYNSNIDVVCSRQKWNLYETVKNFVWCSGNRTSYLLARPKDSATNKFEYLAGICYDTFTLSFKSLYYTMSPKHSAHLTPTVLPKYYVPSLELKYVKETFNTKTISVNDYDVLDIKDWINYSQYNYSSVIQNAIIAHEFSDELGSILDVAWWPNLRLGNWKRYETALANHIESEDTSYDIVSGVSLVAAVPIIETCHTNYTLKELIDNKNREIPMYVWNYLRSTSNSSDEIVIIGINSPFYEFYEEIDVVFCPDKCQEIPWLNKVSKTFNYSALGVIFCCSIEDVKAAQRLDGFPVVNVDSRPRKAKPTVDDITEINDSNENWRNF